MIYWELFYTFFIIGAFTFGGGYAMLSLIQNEVVVNHQWISLEGFTDIVAISQISPGPIGINSATYIGYSVIKQQGGGEFAAFMGSLTATFAVVLPSFLIVLWICVLFSKFKDNIWFNSILKGLRPAIVGMIGAAAVILINPTNFIDWTSWVFFIVAFCLSIFAKVNPILILIISAICGLIIY